MHMPIGAGSPNWISEWESGCRNRWVRNLETSNVEEIGCWQSPTTIQIRNIKRYVAFLSSPIHKPYLINAYTYTTHTSTQTQACLCIHSYIHTYMCIYTYNRERERERERESRSLKKVEEIRQWHYIQGRK